MLIRKAEQPSMKVFDPSLVMSVLRLMMTLLLLAALAAPAQATTWGVVEKTCPLDGKLVRGHVPSSSFSRGMMPDFRPRGGIDLFFSGMLQCPHCGFMTHAGRYDELAGLDREKVAAELRKLDKSSLFYPIDAALTVERCWTNDPGRLAKLALTAKWAADDTGEPEVIRERLKEALAAHNVLVTRMKPEDQEYAAVVYLIGELQRQQGNTAEAVRWFDKALPLADKNLKPMIQQQRSAALIAGAAPAKIIEMLKQAPPAEQVAALELLRAADDAETVQFLSDVVLRSPEEFRESAMQALIGETPRKIHLPIYLQAISDRHYRTVQGGALAVELLRAKEAAPLLVKALEQPVESADYRLTEALAAVATPAEIPALRRLFAERNKQHFLFRALLNTESPEIIDDVLKLLEEDAFYPSLSDKEEQRRTLQSAARNAALMKRLPDLRTADAKSPAAIFKACVLALDDKPESAAELAAALGGEGRLAFQAAVALARRRDPRCRQVLVGQIDDLLRESHEGYLVLLPLLQPADYAPIKRALDQDVAQQKKWLAEMKSELTIVKDEQRKTELTQDIAEREKRENWWMEPWLRLFGATRHPDAKPVLLGYLDDPNHQARAGAIEGLGFCYDPEIGRVLRARLAVERQNTQALIRALGNSHDRDVSSALLAMAAKPTTIETKLALIEALQKLQVLDRLNPQLEAWSHSPNTTLASAAKQALRGERKQIKD